ncbi:trypsin-like serine peptidase [Sporosarcina sp. G11-34]|uniref:trypsin-like serine peptidase n=1 Tax=Sporosarcina sp. G11-34 TaxID=2849605 RepID=UPI0022A983EA|nr:serine protease [Sporosarcina sp. G11-34]MCZ2256906.1 serine protease [Sporosarcina sp. G11-34]
MASRQMEKYQDYNKNLVELQQQQALKRYLSRSSERNRIAKELQDEKPVKVGTPKQVTFRKEVTLPRDGAVFERIIGQNDLFPVSYLEAGTQAAKPVCRIEIKNQKGTILGYGTGFLVTPSLLLTNNHVLENYDTAKFSIAQFNYEIDLDKNERPMKSFNLQPERFFLTNEALDFTLVAVEEVSADGTEISNFGFLSLIPQTGKGMVGEYVSIIQHPSGEPKAVAIRENQILDVFDDYIHYSTDTMPGSSGSPVYNDEWIVISLHHAGVPNPKDQAEFIANEGIRISSIIGFVEEESANMNENQKLLINDLTKARQAVGYEHVSAINI